MNSTKGRIAEAFKELACRKSFQKITISDIAKDCNMTRENFYYHFRDKYDIVRWIFEHEIYNKDEDEGLDIKQWIRSMIYSMEKEKNYYRRIMRQIGKDVIRENFYKIMFDRLRDYIERSMEPVVWNMRKDKIDFVTGFFTDAFIEFLIQSILEGETLSSETFEANFDFLFRNYLPFVRIKKD